MPVIDGLTPSQQRLYDKLSDWLPHTLGELRGCLWDELSNDAALHMLISRTRTRIRRQGLDVISIRRNGTCYYQMERLINRGE